MTESRGQPPPPADPNTTTDGPLADAPPSSDEPPIVTPPSTSMAGPAWRPPRDVGGNSASMIAGLVILAIGVWYLLDHTLGLRMPRIDWGDAWPIILVVIGGVMLIRSAGRRT